MRVISGSKRRINLETPVGDNTRPTTDRIKETLFNMIGPDIYDSNFLDLFAGSGQMGIEALSRGAKHATFIENNPKAICCIKNNLTKTDLNSQSKLITADVFNALKSLNDCYDIVFMDPPYNKNFEKDILKVLSNMSIIDDSTLIIIEASIETEFDYVNEYGFEIIKEKTYKTNKHMFIQRAQ